MDESGVLPLSVAGRPTRLELFLTFAKIGLCGFGGVGPWARRIIVEERAWLSEQEYAEMLGMCQALPGPNVGNVSVFIGDRYYGAVGAALAVTGLLCGPLLALLCLAVLYDRFGQLPAVSSAVAGVAAGAAGLFLGTALRMAERLRLRGWMLAIAACAFVGIGLLRWSLLFVVLVLAPVSIAVAGRSQR
ncbi:MAG: chromate transporter [Chloroflexi bacterium]|nr:chromate transporter [Chloroflexota bacterium]